MSNSTQQQDAIWERSEAGQDRVQDLADVWTNIEGIIHAIDTATSVDCWDRNPAVHANIQMLSQELVQLRNQIRRFTSLSPDLNAQPTTMSFYDQALRDINGLGMLLFDNISVLSRLSTRFEAIMREIARGNRTPTNVIRAALEQANIDYKQRDIGTENVMSQVDERARNVNCWEAYHLREELDIIDSGLLKVMNMFRKIGEAFKSDDDYY